MILFQIKGSSDKPYKVTFSKKDDSVYAGCDCSARKGGLICKHIMNLLDGDITNVIGFNNRDLEELSMLINGTQFEKDYDELKFAIKYMNSKIITECKKKMVLKQS